MVRCLLLFVSLIILWKCSINEGKPSIIFVPGFLCSLLEIRINTTIQTKCPKSIDNQWILLWLNLRLFQPEYFLCFHEIFQLIYNETSMNFENPPGIQTRLLTNSSKSSFLNGLLWEYIGLDQFLFHFLFKHQYEDGINIRSISYDFRRGTNESLNEFCQRLKELIEITYLTNKNEKISLISHSLGGSMTLNFLNQQNEIWKEKYIHSWISLSGNLAGGIDNIQSLIQGFVSPLIPKTILQTWDFYSWRLPNSFIYGTKRILIESPKKNYSSNDFFDFLNQLGAKQLAQVYLKSSLILSTFSPPNVNTFCFFGTNISTPIKYISTSNTFHGKLSILYGSGDGELDDTNNYSCQLWNQTMDPKYQLTIKSFPYVTHVGLLSNSNLLRQIDQILFN
ncbi:unnamed protein product [Adineta ricciae]|uniref:Uncharacterized protein n=1 Tax=Adineta ricciae TaxID=249248 RepID=A0A815DES1_ADIRI|nr:unnamed protein product [Adineta ricciae]CAF1329741.1 unnamed protein product [Adineta ricciae]